MANTEQQSEKETQEKEEKRRFRAKNLFKSSTTRGLPFAPGMRDTLDNEKMSKVKDIDNRRTLYITFIAAINATIVTFIGFGLLALIYFITNICFHGKWSFEFANAFPNHVGWWVIPIPIVGAIIVGLFARYGSRAIQGHGIPEAMESILTNRSKIKPKVTFLKPISSAIAIGTGGPFGAEGPIISTGGAAGSFFGQILKVTAEERKILLAAGAASGMSVVFGCPIASVLLAVELLLFEFSPRAIIPVAIGSAIGAAGHFFLWPASLIPIFGMPNVALPSTSSILIYSVMGVIIGLAAVFVTKATYWIEDQFDKIPIHWMWYPAIGAIVIGVVGYFYPRTLGVGYVNVRNILHGFSPVNGHAALFGQPGITMHAALMFLFAMCVMKFISWSIALSSGTSGGTLAPLFTIGGALGALLGLAAQRLFPSMGVNVSIAAVIGMAGLFCGSARALFTSIIFTIETTLQPNIILPLLSSCTIAYFVSFVFMKSSIMTEKIVRRGVHLPVNFTPDVLNTTEVSQIMRTNIDLISENNTIAEIKKWIHEHKQEHLDLSYCVVDSNSKITGEVHIDDIYETDVKNEKDPISTIAINKPPVLDLHTTVDTALDLLVRQKNQIVAVIDDKNKDEILGTIRLNDIYKAYHLREGEVIHSSRSISLKMSTTRLVVKGKQILKRQKKEA